MNRNTLFVAIAALIVGGVATAGYMKFSAKPAAASAEAPAIGAPLAPPPASPSEPDPADAAIPATPLPPAPAYAEVVDVRPITEKQPLYATVIGTEPVRETSTSSVPREVCEDVVVQERLPERDGNVGGTVVGAVVGGLLGNQVGKGDGRKLATVAGAVAGGYAGHEIDKRHEGGRVVNRTERQCRTVSDSVSNTRTVAWNVTYRTPDGKTASMRTDKKPGSRIALGQETRTIGYDVTYVLDGQRRTVRMDQRPGDRLPVVDGQVVTQVAAADAATSRR